MHILVLISVFITVKSMDYAYEDSDAWTDFDQDKGSIESSFGWRSKNDTVLPYHGPENDKGQRSLQRSVSKAFKYRFKMVLRRSNFVQLSYIYGRDDLNRF